MDWRMRLLVLACFAAVGPAFAAHPLQTEDTGTQGLGNVEIENGLSRMRSAAGSVVVFQPQLSYGVTPSTDFIVQPSWLSVRDRDGSSTRGVGDTNLDGKWRFFGKAPVSLAVRAGLTLPTSEDGLGLAHGDLAEHALLVGTFDAAPLTIHANIGLLRQPAGDETRQWIRQLSVAVLWAVNERLIVTGEAAAASSALAARRAWSKSLLAGVIYTVRPNLDLDAGFQIARSDPNARTVLAGLTFRFGP